MKKILLSLMLSAIPFNAYSVENEQAVEKYMSTIFDFMKTYSVAGPFAFALDNYERAYDMEDGKEKVNRIKKCIENIDSAIGVFDKFSISEIKANSDLLITLPLCNSIKVIALARYGILLFKLHKNEDDLKEAGQKIRQGIEIHEKINYATLRESHPKFNRIFWENDQELQYDLIDTLNGLALERAKHLEGSPDKRMDLFIEIIDYIFLSMRIELSIPKLVTQAKPRPIEGILRSEFPRILGLRIGEVFSIHGRVCLAISQLFEEQQPLYKRFKKIKELLVETDQIIKVCNKYDEMRNYLSQLGENPEHLLIPIENAETELQRILANAKGPGKKSKQKGQPSSSPKQALEMSLRLIPTSFVKHIWVNHCCLLMEASSTLEKTANNFSNTNQDLATYYRDESKKNLKDATVLYKQNLYEGEYEGTELEDRFIDASLHDLIGNPKPLSNFYLEVRKSARILQIVQIIHKAKVEREEAEREKHEVLAKKRQLEQQKQKILAVTRTKSIPLSEPIASPSYAWTTPPVSSNDRTSDGSVPPKEKIKTKGTPGASSSSHHEEIPIVEAPRSLIILDSEDYQTFRRLTGGDPDRVISLDQVKKLLGGLGCAITHAENGSHGKATAPNQQMWTLPPAWEDRKIPPRYRQQLNEFLQILMGIDPELVREEG